MQLRCHHLLVLTYADFYGVPCANEIKKADIFFRTVLIIEAICLIIRLGKLFKLGINWKVYFTLLEWDELSKWRQLCTLTRYKIVS